MTTANLADFLVNASRLTILYIAGWRSRQMLAGIIGAWYISNDRRRRSRRNLELTRKAASRPLVSIIVPAYNEALTIVESIRSLEALEYSHRELVVVNDGSTDGTLAILRERFELVPAPVAFATELPSAAVRGVYRSVILPDLMVIDKVNGGSKADAANAGINAASGELVLCIDADGLLDSASLDRAVLPFLDHPETVAVGGNIGVANGCRIEQGRIVTVGLPRTWMARLQVIEYMQSFLLFRVARAYFNSLTIISGAFGLFRREAVVAIGGFDRTAIGEDMDLTIRLHAYGRRRGGAYRIVFDPFPFCVTQVPEDWTSLRSQRTRWRRGFLQVLWRHRRMIGNPRFGVLGLIVLPSVACFEGLGPLLAVGGYAIFTIGVLTGLLDVWHYVTMVTTSMIFGTAGNLFAVFANDVATGWYDKPRDLLKLGVIAVVERLGYRQLNLWWGCVGTVQAMLGRRGWGSMKRRTFDGGKAA
jgi:cellulose synthase/poly-beta-1,6-N-acetylglucosamine synthase-like glycosyltransferase